MKHLVFFLSLALLALTLSACDSGVTPDMAEPELVIEDDFAFSKKPSSLVPVGDSPWGGKVSYRFEQDGSFLSRWTVTGPDNTQFSIRATFDGGGFFCALRRTDGKGVNRGQQRSLGIQGKAWVRYTVRLGGGCSTDLLADTGEIDLP